MLGHQSHAVAGNQAAVSVGDFHPGILRGDGHIAQHGGIPVEAGARNGADGGHIQVKHHILDQVGVVKILVLEALGGQFRISLPAVGIGLSHPAVTNVGENDDLVFEVQGQDPGQLRAGTVRHAGMLHGAVEGLPGDLADAVLPVQVCKVLKPLLVLVKLRELDIIGQRLVHTASSLIEF